MKFEIENSVIASYKRLSYDPWYAFAEFIDNSTQSFIDNKEELTEIFTKNGQQLVVSISYDRLSDLIVVSDNSYGMDRNDLERAFKVGLPPENADGRSKYGLGMKTAACWFGDFWTVETKKLGSPYSYKLEIDVNKIASSTDEVTLIPEEVSKPSEDHYTIITITKLNRKFVGRKLGRIRELLSSIYRFDIVSGTRIEWNGSALTWEGLERELHVTVDGKQYKKSLNFVINGKHVMGWVGVLGKGFGTRKKGGFSVIQNKRVIEYNYKPTSIFGEQEEGSNDLINQRVVGELYLDGFAVSHTKDKIVWEDDEEELMDLALGEFCLEAKEMALTLRHAVDVISQINKFKYESVAVLSSEFKSSEVSNYLENVHPFPEEIIEASYKQSSNAAKSSVEPTIIEIGTDSDMIRVHLYFNDRSEFEPYVIHEAMIRERNLSIIINILHPIIQEMTSSESFTGYVRQAVYDGVAEWKSVKLRGNIQPHTVKFIKDGLLRIPYEIKSNQFVP